MNPNDPFNSHEIDKTVILPSPGKRPSPISRTVPEPIESLGIHNVSLSEIDLSIKGSGINPLVAAANPLLNIATIVRSIIQFSDLNGLHDSLVEKIKSFENTARDAKLAPEKIIATRYALCTFLDESIASTPWGSSEWGKYSLLITFHNEAVGGEKFFQLLAKLVENPKTNLDILEFMYICLALGFEGRYRVLENGKTQLELLRERLAQEIEKQHQKYECDLSPHWLAATTKRTKFFLFMPLWVLASLSGLIILVTFLSFSFVLNNASDPIFNKIQLIRTKNNISLQLPIAQPSPEPFLAEFLINEINERLVTVHQENGLSIVTLLGDGLFTPGSATLSPKYVPVIKRIADALNSRSGQIQILGHTDNQPIRTARFPSNWHLSKERAQSIMQLLIRLGINETRINAEGRADAEPITSNATPEGRSRNRRVEIIVMN